tara:strand:- start:24697 stop:25284 length:588 start_codon:yes stop_codon:yes gene_type:complete
MKKLSRRKTLEILGQGTVLTGLSALSGGVTMAASADLGFADAEVYDQIGLELVMNIVPICTAPEVMGPEDNAADGVRNRLWPIVGGWFWGNGISGRVIPGGGDFPVTRPDGVTVIDALYRLETDDEYQIIIHNKGLAYPNGTYRLAPIFNITGDKYAWLRDSTFVANLVVPVPEEIRRPLGPNENDRLIQVFRLV